MEDNDECLDFIIVLERVITTWLNESKFRHNFMAKKNILLPSARTPRPTESEVAFFGISYPKKRLLNDTKIKYPEFQALIQTNCYLNFNQNLLLNNIKF